MKAARGRPPGKLRKQPHRLPHVWPPHHHTARGGDRQKALAWETGSCPCFAQRDLLSFQQCKEQGSRALLTGESCLSSHCKWFCSKAPCWAQLPFKHRTAGCSASVPWRSHEQTGFTFLVAAPDGRAPLVLGSRHCQSLHTPTSTSRGPCFRSSSTSTEPTQGSKHQCFV